MENQMKYAMKPAIAPLNQQGFENLYSDCKSLTDRWTQTHINQLLNKVMEEYMFDPAKRKLSEREFEQLKEDMQTLLTISSFISQLYVYTDESITE
jgi:hypothetical protein